MTTEQAVQENAEQPAQEQTPIVTQPIPGVNVTLPAQDTIRGHISGLANIIKGMPFTFLSSQQAWGKLVELEVWLNAALMDFKNYQDSLKARQEQEAAKKKDVTVKIEDGVTTIEGSNIEVSANSDTVN